uniref:Amino acid transporter transmembrane domain-containing protein n=1 Tax=Phlebotomus papatasi TaxID=29031 RepID=A0A1B0DHF4_PHLPP
MSSGNYDPHLHREGSNRLSSSAALVHILKAIMGSGILAMPDAMKNCGYIGGSVGTVLITVLILCCIHMLVRCSYVICKKHRVPIMSYAETVKAAVVDGPPWLRPYANCFHHLVNIFLIFAQIGICCIYVAFTAENLRKIIMSELDFHMDLRLYMLALLVPFILLCFIRNLKYLAPISMVANVLTIVGLSIVLYYIYRDGLSFEDRRAFSPISQWPLFVGTVFFTLGSIGVVVSVEYDMETPQDFGGLFGIMNIAMSIVSLLGIFIGVSGYLKYGEDIKGSVTLNFPTEEILSKSVTLVYALAIFTTYPLQAYAAIHIMCDYLKKHYKEDTNMYKIWDYSIRAAFVTVTTLLAIAVPNLALIISIMGALCMTMTGFFFPAIVEICVMYSEHGVKCGYISRDLLIILLGIIGFASGIYVAIRSISA